MTSPLLAVTGLRAGYAGTTVLDGVDLTVPAGGVVALLGRNGAGKTTFVHTVMGLLKPYQGSVRIGGKELAGAPAHVVARHRVAIVPQGRRVFAPLTVAEQVRLAAGRRGVAPGPRSPAGGWTVPAVYELMPQLALRRGNRGDQLSGGEQQMLAIARALLGNPQLLLLDEPSDGLAPVVVEQVVAVLTRLVAEGISALLVEQNLHLALQLADQVAVMRRGQIAYQGSTAAFQRDRDRAHTLLGIG